MSRPAGFIIDVPITLTIAVRGASLEQAKQYARDFVATIEASVDLGSHMEIAGLPDGVTITEVSVESSREDECEMVDELQADED